MPIDIQRIAPRGHRIGADALTLGGHALLEHAQTLILLARWDDGDDKPNGEP